MFNNRVIKKYSKIFAQTALSGLAHESCISFKYYIFYPSFWMVAFLLISHFRIYSLVRHFSQFPEMLFTSIVSDHTAWLVIISYKLPENVSASIVFLCHSTKMGIGRILGRKKLYSLSIALTYFLCAFSWKQR